MLYQLQIVMLYISLDICDPITHRMEWEYRKGGYYIFILLADITAVL
jgi:hypothetical protein